MASTIAVSMLNRTLPGPVGNTLKNLARNTAEEFIRFICCSETFLF